MLQQLPPDASGCAAQQNSERDHSHPYIAAGGISAINPEPLRDFVDFFGVGDGEALFPDIIAALKQAKKQKWDRQEFFEKMEHLEGIYVPNRHKAKRRGLFFQPELKEKKIRKRVISNIQKSFPHEKIIVPIGNVVFDRLDVELGRGCPQRCRFCQAQSYYAPYRIASPQHTIRFVKSALENTGFETLSLSSLSSGDYPHLPELLGTLPDVLPQCTSLSISSLRPSTLSDQLLATIARFRKTGITIVPEAGSQRLRDVINKNVDQTEILAAVETALNNHWQQIKLYFMIGLPTETEDDLTAIVDLLKEILWVTKRKGRSIQIHVSFSSFVPKPHTALQWSGREPLEETKRKIAFLKMELKRFRNLRFDFHPPERGIVETILSRGDSRVGELIHRAYKAGEIFSAWDSHFNFRSWSRLIDQLDVAVFLQPIPLSQPLPWDFLEINYHKDHLMAEYQRALTATTTASCWDQECRTCAGCGLPWQKPKESQGRIQTEIPVSEPAPPSIQYNKIRIFYRKDGDYRFFSHLSLIKYIERLIRKTGIKFKCTEGFHPRLKASHLPPLPVYATGCEEIIEMYMDARWEEKAILSSLNKTSPDFHFQRVEICNHRPPLPKDIHYIVYRFKVENGADLLVKIEPFVAATDAVAHKHDSLYLKMDISREGIPRFGKIYKTLDPNRESTHNLTRQEVIFKHDIPN